MVKHFTLDNPLHGPRAKFGIEPRLSNALQPFLGILQRDAAFGQQVPHPFKLQAYDLFDLVFLERREYHDLVDTVQELGADALLKHRQYQVLGILDHLLPVQRCDLLEVLADHVRPQVGCHDDNGVLEIHHPPLVVGKPSIVQHLQEDIEHVGVRLLDLIEQHHGVRLAANRLGKLSPLVVSHVPRRSTDKPCRAELLLVLAHIDTGHHVLVVEQVLGQRLRQFGLPHAGGPQEDKRSDRPFGIAQSRPCTPYRIGNGRDRFLLPYHPLVQFLFEVEQLLPLTL